jgi:hypothetical protein
MDHALKSFLTTPDQADSEEKLGELLVRHAAPVIRRIVARRLSAFSDADDVVSQVMLELMLRLRQGRVESNLYGIDAFAGYVAAAAHHACDHYLRRMHPARWRLRNRLRYVLEHDPQFALWKSAEGSWHCGCANWPLRTPAGSPPPIGSLAVERKPDARDLLLQIFELSKGPLELATVVDIAATA